MAKNIKTPLQAGGLTPKVEITKTFVERMEDMFDDFESVIKQMINAVVLYRVELESDDIYPSIGDEKYDVAAIIETTSRLKELLFSGKTPPRGEQHAFAYFSREHGIDPIVFFERLKKELNLVESAYLHAEKQLANSKTLTYEGKGPLKRLMRSAMDIHAKYSLEFDDEMSRARDQERFARVVLRLIGEPAPKHMRKFLDNI